MSLMAKSARTAAGKTLITSCGRKLRKRGHKALCPGNRKNPLITSHNICAPVVTRRLTYHGEFVPINEVADTAGLCNAGMSGKQQQVPFQHQ